MVVPVVMVVLASGCGGAGGTAARSTDVPSGSSVAADERNLDALYIQTPRSGTVEGWRLDRLFADGSTEEVPTPAGADIEEPDVSPDGTKVAYAATGTDPDGIWITDLTRPDAEPRPLGTDDGVGCPRWFPDGRRLAAVADDQVIVIDVATGESDAIGPRTRGLDLSCADPIDDAALAVVAAPPEDEWRPELSMLTIDDGAVTLMGTLPERCILNSPASAPDGQEVAVVAICDDTAHNGLYRLAVDGGDVATVVAENPRGTPVEQAFQYWDPAWSVDGRTIVYHRSGSAPSSVRSVGRTGDHDREVARASSCCPTVGPGPRRG